MSLIITNNNNNNIDNMTTPDINTYHNLTNEWVFWAHLPHDTDWSINSYKYINKVSTVEETIATVETFPEILVKNCMLFMSKNGVKPTWEDPNNRNGGCFSYKIPNKIVYTTWKELCYVIVGNTISSNPKFVSKVTGITISPKKNFCIIKIWMSDCTNQNSSIITNDVSGIISNGCLFKKHTPEY